MVAFCHGKKADCLACYRHDVCVKLRNPFNLQVFDKIKSGLWGGVSLWAEFWLRVEREWAEEEKKQLYYPFDCDGFDCDECVDRCDAYYEWREEEEALERAEEEPLEEEAEA